MPPTASAQPQGWRRKPMPPTEKKKCLSSKIQLFVHKRGEKGSNDSPKKGKKTKKKKQHVSKTGGEGGSVTKRGIALLRCAELRLGIEGTRKTSEKREREVNYPARERRRAPTRFPAKGGNKNVLNRPKKRRGFRHYSGEGIIAKGSSGNELVSTTNARRQNLSRLKKEFLFCERFFPTYQRSTAEYEKGLAWKEVMCNSNG